MVRSLWTGASGMIAQQLNVDNISNNMANANTTGYKTEVMEFKSLLYQTIQTKSTTANGETQKPIGAEVGLGVRNSSIMSVFKQGNMLATEIDTDFAINGDGFFAVRGAAENGEAADSTYYTRNGRFLFSVGEEGMTLTNSDGQPVLSTSGEPIVLQSGQVANKVTISADGELFYPDEKGKAVSMGVRIGLFQFSNPSGLLKVGDSLYKQTEASGEAMNEQNGEGLVKSKLKQGYLEGSNVQIADEMVNLIVAQRAYEMNSKVITTSDEMMQQANSLKR